MKRKPGNHTWVISFLFYFLGGMTILVGGILFWGISQEKPAEYFDGTAQGQIVNVTSHSGNHTTTYYVTVSYSVDGKEYGREGRFGKKELVKMQTNNSVSVLYHSESPEEAVLNQTQESLRSWRKTVRILTGGILTMGLLCLAVPTIIFRRRKKKKDI